jgi:hypothetical protein
VQDDNLGQQFLPKLPEELALVPAPKKLEVVRMLTADNEMILEKLFKRLDSEWSLGLARVPQARDVNDNGKIQVKYSRKTTESILAKASRPSILAENPSFSVEHVRDTFRYRVKSIFQYL